MQDVTQFSTVAVALYFCVNCFLAGMFLESEIKWKYPNKLVAYLSLVALILFGIPLVICKNVWMFLRFLHKYLMIDYYIMAYSDKAILKQQCAMMIRLVKMHERFKDKAIDSLNERFWRWLLSKIVARYNRIQKEIGFYFVDDGNDKTCKQIIEQSKPTT